MTQRNKRKRAEEQQEIEQEKTNSRQLQAKTEGQQTLIDAITNNTITFVEGPSGCGKTIISVGLAVEALRRGHVKKIVVSRPLVQAGEDVGTIPGDTMMKMNPYLLAVFDEMLGFITKAEFNTWVSDGRLEICPLGFMRGRTFHHSFVILDEAQNATYEQLIMFLTRTGKESIVVVNGDGQQTDLHRSKAGAFASIIDKLRGLQGIGTVRLGKQDILRNPIIASILDRLEGV